MRGWIKIVLYVIAAGAVIGLSLLGLMIYKDQKYTQSKAWTRSTFFRKTGATAKSVLNCENRFSRLGWRL